MWSPCGAMWGPCGATCDPRGATWDPRGATCDPRGAMWIPHGASWDPRGATWAPCGATWAPCGATWTVLPREDPTESSHGVAPASGRLGRLKGPKVRKGRKSALLRSQNVQTIITSPSPIGVSPFGGPGAPEVLQSALLRTFALLGSQNHQISITFYLPRALGSLWSAKVLQSYFWATWSVLTAPTVKFHQCFTFQKSI